MPTLPRPWPPSPPTVPGPPQGPPGSQPMAGLAQPCPGAAGRQRGPGTMAGIRDKLEGVREAPGAPSAPVPRARWAAERRVSRQLGRRQGPLGWQCPPPPRCEQSRGHSCPASGPADPHGGGRKGSSAPPLISFWKSTRNKERTAVHAPCRHDNHWHFVPIVSTLSLFQCRI